MFSQLSDSVEFLKYFTVYTLGDLRNVIVDISINPVMILISLVITLSFIIGSFIKYERKELV